MPLLNSEHLKLTHSAYLVFQQAPDPFQTTTVNPFVPRTAQFRLLDGTQFLSCSDTGPVHWRCSHSSLCFLLTSLQTLTALNIFCLQDPDYI